MIDLPCIDKQLYRYKSCPVSAEVRGYLLRWQSKDLVHVGPQHSMLMMTPDGHLIAGPQRQSELIPVPMIDPESTSKQLEITLLQLAEAKLKTVELSQRLRQVAAIVERPTDANP
jgi:hypothetical protein